MRIWFLILMLSGMVFADSKPTKIVPANGASVSAPKAVSIAFNEGIEGRFSTFKVYPYTGEVNNNAIRAFARAKLPLKNDTAARADVNHNAVSSTKNVQIQLKPNLAKGVYVVMWRILGADTHIVEGWSFFRIK
jgi:copper resistance protein C